ncbi:MAG: PmeII family type II restriction endonuclease [Anaerolineaceae bacterium]|nr:PmeII family type II restriction endonuclease [Anaerolineaceae bacterium]MCY4105953.1 PmeII family type II restriction endonuclease [Chloroflexota bacterium]
MRDVPGWWQAALPEIHTTLEGFSSKLRKKLKEQPEKIIRRKNPFLYRVRHSENASASDLAASIVDAFLSSSEETMFGDVLESLSIIICRHAKSGRKSGIENIDLEFDQADGSRALVQVKSGENWGNSSQRKTLVEKFGRATRVLRQGGIRARCIEGCCYGSSRHVHREYHEILVGDVYWKEISDWSGTSQAILTIIGEHADNGLHAPRREARDNILQYFSEQNLLSGHSINWNRLLQLVMRPK